MADERTPDLATRLAQFHEWFTVADKAFAPEGWRTIALEAKAEIERLRASHTSRDAKLVESVAAAFSACLPYSRGGWDEQTPERQKMCREGAQLAIPIVIEKAAKVADAWGNLPQIAASIRALKSPSVEPSGRKIG
jgi:hypothetical protein